jgi:ribosomal protein S18 acetylase RimI-like enzyme
MSTVVYRIADKSDIPAMAQIKAGEGGSEDFLRDRISGYLDLTHHPQHALMPRVMYVALDGDSVVGFIAGHLTRRFGCDGELQWVNVVPKHRSSGVASGLIRLLATWFAVQKASRICVNVDPTNATARRFYTRQGADILNEHWMVWTDFNVVLGEQTRR